MDHNLLVPLGNLYSTASGAIEKNVYYCVDFICTFVFQDRDYKQQAELITLYHVYLDMLIENEDEEENMMSLEDLKTPEFYDFVWRLYNSIYHYLAPMLKKADWYISTMNHMQIINNNLFMQLDLDGDGNEEPLCSLPNLAPINSSI